MSLTVRIAAKAVDVFIGCLLLAIVLITLAATGNRYLLGGALPWSEELNLLLWVWMIQFAALRSAPIRVGYLVDKLPKRWATAIGLSASVCSIAALIVLTWGAVKMAQFVSGDFYVSMPGVSEKYVFFPLLIVGPAWILIIVANVSGWTRLNQEQLSWK